MLDIGKVHQGDCLELMKQIDDQSIDMILCDLPYQATECEWDSAVPLEPLWERYKRIVKPSSAIVLTATQPFASKLIMSNLKMFKYDLIWDKVGTTGFQNANIMPLRRHESILVFYAKKPNYSPKMTVRGEPRKKGGSRNNNGCYGEIKDKESFNNLYFPTSIVVESNANKTSLVHPTQKPVALFEYLIRTYTQPGDLVLDNCAGSGTTGVACLKTGRQFILMEQEAKYCEIASSRIQEVMYEW